MIDYTRAAFTKIFNDIKKLGVIFNVSSSLFMIAYLTYVVVANETFRILNGILLTLAVAYFIFYLIISKDGASKKEQAIKKRVTVFYTIVKRIAKLYTLGVAIFGLYTSFKTVDLISMFLTVFTLVTFLLQIAIDVITFLVERYKNIVMAGIEMDMKPITAVMNVKKKLFGQAMDLEQSKAICIAFIFQ